MPTKRLTKGKEVVEDQQASPNVRDGVVNMDIPLTEVPVELDRSREGSRERITEQVSPREQPIEQPKEQPRYSLEDAANSMMAAFRLNFDTATNDMSQNMSQQVGTILKSFEESSRQTNDGLASQID